MYIPGNVYITGDVTAFAEMPALFRGNKLHIQDTLKVAKTIYCGVEGVPNVEPGDLYFNGDLLVEGDIRAKEFVVCRSK